MAWRFDSFSERQIRVARVTAALAVAFVIGLLLTHRGRVQHAAQRADVWPAAVRPLTIDQAMEELHAARGHAVLLVVYASWCSGCRQEMPFVDELAESYRARGLHVSALARDDDEPGDYVEWMAGKTPHYEQLRLLPSPDGTLRTAIGKLGGRYADSIPYAAVFDRDGTLAREWPSGGATKNAVEESIVAALAREASSTAP